MHYFKDLEVWKISMCLVVKVYTITKSFPAEEKFGLVSQINRSAVSVAANIAEGCGRSTTNDFNHFLDMSMGSCFELETLLLVAQSINYLNGTENMPLMENIHSIQKMLYALKKSNTNKA